MPYWIKRTTTLFISIGQEIQLLHLIIQSSASFKIIGTYNCILSACFLEDDIDDNKCNDSINRTDHDNTSCVGLLTP